MSEQQHNHQNQTPEQLLHQQQTDLLRAYAEDTIKNVMVKGTDEMFEYARDTGVADDILAPVLEVSIHTTQTIMYPDFTRGVIEKNKLMVQARKALKDQRQIRNVKISEQDVIDSLDQDTIDALETIQGTINAVPIDTMRLAAIGKYRGLINPDFIERFDSILDVDESVTDVYYQYEYDRAQAHTAQQEEISHTEFTTAPEPESLSPTTTSESTRRHIGSGTLRSALRKIATGVTDIFKAA